MKRPRWLWRLASVFWAAAILSWCLPGIAEAAVLDFNDIRFSLSNVLTLIAVGFAWGDMRQWRAQVDKRLDKLEG